MLLDGGPERWWGGKCVGRWLLLYSEIKDTTTVCARNACGGNLPPQSFILIQIYTWSRHLLGLKGKGREGSTPGRGNRMYDAPMVVESVMFEHLKEVSEGDVELGWRRQKVACIRSSWP